MSLYDNIKCKFPLPFPGANDAVYQTKDTPQYFEDYEIREDGTLWHQFASNRPWKQDKELTGEICFHDGKLRFSAYFVRGKLRLLYRVDGEEPVEVEVP